MRKLVSLIAAAGLSLGLIASPALANSCPKHMTAIDAALAKGGFDQSKAAQAKSLRDEGEALHKAGKHDESMAKLTQAEKLLGISGH